MLLRQQTGASERGKWPQRAAGKEAAGACGRGERVLGTQNSVCSPITSSLLARSSVLTLLCRYSASSAVRLDRL